MTQLYILTDSGDVDYASAAEIEAAGYMRNSEVLRLVEMSEAALREAKAEVQAIIAFEPVVRELLSMAYCSPKMDKSVALRLKLAVDTMYADTPEAS